MNLKFWIQTDPLSQTSLDFCNGQLKSIKITDNYNINRVNEKLDEVTNIGFRQISCSSSTNYYRIILKTIY